MKIKLTHAGIEYVGYVIIGDHFLTGPRETVTFCNSGGHEDVEVGSDLYQSLLKQILNLPELVYSGAGLDEYDLGILKETITKRLSEFDRVKAKHTPGIWGRNIKPASKYPTIYAGRNTHVAVVCTKGLTEEEIEANCNLIRSAPELLAALEKVLADLKKEDRPGTDISEIEETICIAKGIPTRFEFGMAQMKLAFNEANAPLEPGEKTFRLVRTGHAYKTRQRHGEERRFYDSDTGKRITENFNAYGIRLEEVSEIAT